MFFYIALVFSIVLCVSIEKAAVIGVASAAAINVQSSKCSIPGYFIPVDIHGNPLTATRYLASYYCRGALNLGVAGDTTATNFELGNLITACAPQKAAWVSSWNGDNYQGTPIYMTQAYNSHGGYTIVADVTASQELPVICKKANNN